MSDFRDVEDISEENQVKHEWQCVGGKENKNLTTGWEGVPLAQAPHFGTPTCAGRGFRLDVSELGRKSFVCTFSGASTDPSRG